jgi:hypothetical protein
VMYSAETLWLAPASVEAGVGHVGQPGGAVHVAALLRDAAVDADEPCAAQRTHGDGFSRHRTCKVRLSESTSWKLYRREKW